NTDENGNYSLATSSTGGALQFSILGFEKAERTFSDNTPINVALKQHIDHLEEVVVVGYGTQKKGNLTGSVQSISGADILRRTTSTGSVALQGMVPGLSAVQSSGQ